METVTYSVVIPVYRNAESLGELLRALADLDARLGHALEAVFVVDASPDDSHAILRDLLPQAGFNSQLLLLSRNFGSFAAIRCGLGAARGRYLAVLAADLQEPPQLLARFFEVLSQDEIDVVVGTRISRNDPWFTRTAAALFWRLYRRLINPAIPQGGVDLFACNTTFRDQLLALEEHHSSLIGLIFWLGFRRAEVPYERLARRHGRSAWTLQRKITYMLDSVFSFSDLPVRLLLLTGIVGITVAIALGLTVLAMRLAGGIGAPGYTATMITILFFGGLNALGLGIIGAYVWRAFANTQRRPLAILMHSESFSRTAPEP